MHDLVIHGLVIGIGQRGTAHLAYEVLGKGAE